MHSGVAFGCLSVRTSQHLKRLSNISCVVVECIASVTGLRKARTEWQRSGNSAQLLVTLNVYGHDHAAFSVGDSLAAAKLFLQVPPYDRRSAMYDNPQYLKLPDVGHISLNEEPVLNSQPPSEDQNDASTAEIATLFDHIPQCESLNGVFSSDRIKTPLIK